LNPKRPGTTYGRVDVEGVSLLLRSNTYSGEQFVEVEINNNWAGGGGRMPAYALILACDAIRSIVSEIEPERLRTPPRWVCASPVGGGP